MTSSRSRFLVLFLLALLQCFAPLLHAHAHGISVEGKVHMHGEGEAPLLASPVHEHPAFQSFMADRDEAPVIAMAQEFRQDSTIALSGDPQPVLTVSSPEFSAVRPVPAGPACLVSPGGRCSYLSPFSQAPPSALI
ncbi:MAG: hypothetical protein C3F18_03065 [Nitrosomonadales bacterium]|nr:MAG: hypothetical protein C3F18_03065 [Nitrosomonadales bacterium]